MAEKAAAEQAPYRALTHEAVERGRGPEIRAKNQYNRGNRLKGLGSNEAAIKATRDAVVPSGPLFGSGSAGLGRYRELVTTSPDTCERLSRPEAGAVHREGSRGDNAVIFATLARKLPDSKRKKVTVGEGCE